MTQLNLRIAGLVMAVALVAGCGAGRSYGRGQSAAKAGNWDVAVEQYRQAVQQEPSNAEYRIALERAMLNASRVHFDAARERWANSSHVVSTQRGPGNEHSILRTPGA